MFKWLFLIMILFLNGCATINIGSRYTDPLKLQVIQQVNNPEAKVLIIEINGVISDEAGEKMMSREPSLLDKVMMQLAAAEQQKDIATVLLKVNSPGGGVTTSDILYHELLAFKQRTGIKIYVQMMDIAASGGYYLAMAADHIQAHPTTITGSVGVITVLTEISGLADKIGLKVNTFKSGKNKDTGSPFRPLNEADKAEFETMIAEMAERFHSIVQQNRHLSDQAMEEVKTAKVYTGEAALKSGLVDSLGYLTDATVQACQLAGKTRCDVVSYRFDKNVNATLYSPNMASGIPQPKITLVQSGLLESAIQLTPGSYYLYLP